MEQTIKMKMILDIDPAKSAIASISSAFTGSVMANISLVEANTAFQHAAWTVAIIAGIVSIVNGIIKIREYFRKTKSDEEIINTDE